MLAGFLNTHKMPRRRGSAPSPKKKNTVTSAQFEFVKNVNNFRANALTAATKIFSDPCRMCDVDADKESGVVVVDRSKPFLFTCIGIVDVNGCVEEDGYYLAKQSDLITTSGRPLVVVAAAKNCVSLFHHLFCIIKF
jgi:hypothetical protein